MAGLTCVVRLAGRTWRHVRRALPEASGRLEALVEAWRALRMEELAEAQELMRREEELRDELKESCFWLFLAVFSCFQVVFSCFHRVSDVWEACEYGDPADTWTPTASAHPVVGAHNDVARKLIETELGRLQWMVRCGEALGHPDLPLGKQPEAI